MPNKTAHYQLNQWEPGDNFLRSDFNEDNAKIDAALAGLNTAKCEIVMGSYTGNGAATRTIELGFRPKAVILTDSNGIFNTSAGINGGLVLDGLPGGGATISENGFTVQNPSGYSSLRTNQSGTVYHYLVFC